MKVSKEGLELLVREYSDEGTAAAMAEDVLRGYWAPRLAGCLTVHGACNVAVREFVRNGSVLPYTADVHEFWERYGHDGRVRTTDAMRRFIADALLCHLWPELERLAAKRRGA